MKHMIWAIELALALGATPAAAQTRVSVAVGFGVPQPLVRGFVVVGRPFAYYPPAYVVVRRPYFYRHRRPLLFVRRVYVGRDHRRHRWDGDESLKRRGVGRALG